MYLKFFIIALAECIIQFNRIKLQNVGCLFNEDIFNLYLGIIAAFCVVDIKKVNKLHISNEGFCSLYDVIVIVPIIKSS